MPLKLGQQGNNGTEFTGAPIDSKTVIKMVKAYRLARRQDRFAFKFSQFDVIEVLQLLFDNKIISKPSLKEILNNNPNLKNYGLKIYLGTHTEEEDCPDHNKNYLYHDAPILCTTELTGKSDTSKGEWVDMLNDTESDYQDNDSIIYSARDKTYLCPPGCESDII